MKRIPFLTALLLLVSATLANAQYESTLPQVTINDRAVNLQRSLYPDYYHSHSARSDMRWVRRHD
ncbi:MAG: hypothetical protein D6800_04850, partial [Candidatus Zixiibacteriota bacterium]